ncbi:MAG: SEC-C metal-binding domain-containing protein, partial [Fusobacteriaceae bacterium]
MRLFGSERVIGVMNRLGLPKGEPIAHRMITNAIKGAQMKIESRNFGIRKNLLEFDDVMNQQRKIIYDSRNNALEKDNLKESIIGMIRSVVESAVISRFVGDTKEVWDIKGLSEFLYEKYGYSIENLQDYKSSSIEEYTEKLTLDILQKYEEKEKEYGFELMRRLEKYILLEIVDARWREHLKNLDALREGIYLRSYGQKDPVIEYKILSGEMYGRMIETIKEEASSYLFKVVVKTKEEQEPQKKIKPDDDCPCGSGKKYKKCCGRK